MKHELLMKNSPLEIEISFKKLFDAYRERLLSGSNFLQTRAKEILAVAEAYPLLSKGITTEAQLEELQPQINLVLEDLFASVLENNEIRIATLPFSEYIFRSSKRYQDIMKVAGPEYDLQLTDFSQDEFYIMGCSIILGAHYGYKVDFRRPFFYDIPDAQGIIRHYRVLYNGDFMNIEKTKESKEVTKEDVALLLDNFDDVALWKKIFPPDSWKFSGFVVANLYDATTDVSLSNFKANLLQIDNKDENFAIQFKTIVRAVFNLSSLEVGYAVFNTEENTFEHPPEMVKVKSYVLNGEQRESCNEALCPSSYASLITKHESYCISDVDRFAEMYPENILYKKLQKQEVKSAIITPIVSDGELLGMLEIVSPNPSELNTINANKLVDIMPFLADSVQRSKEKAENELELLIQEECTSIHPSVHWKFKKEAKRVIEAQLMGEQPSFQEIVFEDVYPLFGQIDIKGSSEARNVATQKDLLLQLNHVKKIINRIYKIDILPIYEQINFRIDSYIRDLTEKLEVDSERQVLNFLRSEIIPLFSHLSKKSPPLKQLIEEYRELIQSSTGLVYHYRKQYDDSVMTINKRLSALLDLKQKQAQSMYPHYFERFKTDGIEHNLYIGESITKKKSFNKVYLYNLRLWQLQVMCEMENHYYRLKEKLPVPLDVASMILVFNSSLALRFRMDEKRFDVDGTYNARYEVVKKRVDKAHIKGTEERVTQAGKIAIIFSQSQDEKEYLKYISFLQSKKHLDDDVEILELEDLQGVTGLRALRVRVLYTKGKSTGKQYFTYEDLMKEISA